MTTNSYEELVNLTAAIGMDLQNYQNYTEPDKKTEIWERIERNQKLIMQTALQLREHSMEIYNSLMKIYPVSLKDTLSAYCQGSKESEIILSSSKQE